MPSKNVTTFLATQIDIVPSSTGTTTFSYLFIGRGHHTIQYVWRSQNNMWGLGHSFHYASARDRTQGVRPSHEGLNPLSHCIAPGNALLINILPLSRESAFDLENQAGSHGNQFNGCKGIPQFPPKMHVPKLITSLAAQTQLFLEFNQHSENDTIFVCLFLWQVFVFCFLFFFPWEHTGNSVSQV